ncbi:IF-2B-domain-containing protein [Aspergillus japonicus CBS 114.51]|uniref:Translation initiation factor eIF2B subunit delta n=1 Tax=Aspergillus japonicus CBS 114.51 TaxID=1448312 RepID=A0A8T8WKD2_ASPJA|nr:IF-2B-domain-containing protein [Aspergillus japonicus CBS 114.51]RAH76217.1 IF-2B-domain-containing protein [Aspergillus japonicus CBS 114.51]
MTTPILPAHTSTRSQSLVSATATATTTPTTGEMTSSAPTAPSPSPAAAGAAAPTTSTASTAPTSSKPTKQQSSSQSQKPSKPANKSKDAATSGTAAGAPAPADGAPAQLTPAELKKRAKAEKAARRARERAERESGPAGGAPAGAATPGKKDGSGSAAGSTGGGGGSKQLPRRGSAQNTSQNGGGGSVSGTGAAAAGGLEKSGGGSGGSGESKSKKADDKNVAVFGHLYGQQRRTTVAGAGKEVHPAVLALGLQMRDYVVCGSSARCVATLLAFKRVIEAYTTPMGTSLPRHLTTYLSHQITYLSTCRPLSISQGNAIRALKLAISSIDPSTPEAEAKAFLGEFIDSFIREKITVADQVIASSAAQKIQDGDVIVTFAGSSIVKQTLLLAHKQGKKFRVSIIDSRPLFEGKSLARTLANAGLDVQYSLVHGISHAIKAASKVFLGAHAMTSNGRLYSRVGTALVAMSAKERAGGVEVPVIVCCETVKFTDRVALDSIVVNEIADADELITAEPMQQLTGLPDPAAVTASAADAKKGGGGGGGKSAAAAAAAAANAAAESNTLAQSVSSPLTGWKESANLQLLNIMYDVTPAEYVDMVVTEMGSLPPSAVPIVHRMSTNL